MKSQQASCLLQNYVTELFVTVPLHRFLHDYATTQLWLILTCSKSKVLPMLYSSASFSTSGSMQYETWLLPIFLTYEPLKCIYVGYARCHSNLAQLTKSHGITISFTHASKVTFCIKVYTQWLQHVAWVGTCTLMDMQWVKHCTMMTWEIGSTALYILNLSTRWK
jgi:hypothetical protein